MTIKGYSVLMLWDNYLPYKHVTRLFWLAKLVTYVVPRALTHTCKTGARSNSMTNCPQWNSLPWSLKWRCVWKSKVNMSYLAALGYFRRGYQRKDTVYPILFVWFRDANFYNFDQLKGDTIIFSTISKFTVKYLIFWLMLTCLATAETLWRQQNIITPQPLVSVII